jgi:hypothetical protein
LETTTKESTSPQERQPIASPIRQITDPRFLVYVLLSLFAISFIPKFIPSAQTASDSYLFGYNNRAGIVLLLCSVAIGVLWTRGLKLQFLPRSQSAPVPVGTLAFSLFTIMCGCVIMYLFAGRYGGFGESFYVIDRAWLLADGKAPYRDFEFAYGPAMLYGPVIFHSILSIDLPKAYYLFWAASYLFGTFLLFKTVNMIDYPSARKQEIYLLLFLPGIFPIVRMGTNYTFLRFVCPLFFVLVIQKWFRDSTNRWSIGTVLASAVFTAILLSISAETAIAFAFACIWICLFSGAESGRVRGAKASAQLAAFALPFWTAKELHILDTLLADGSGAISFPILMAPHILLFFASIFVCGCYLYWRFHDRRIDDNTIGLVGYSVPMITAALGRCDPSHLFWNGLGIFLAAMFYLSYHKKAWSIFRAAFLLFAFLLPNASEFYLFLPQLRAARFLNEHGRDSGNRGDVGSLFQWSGQFLAPFGYRPNGFGTFRSTRVDYGRFEEVIDVSTPRTVEEKVAEMKSHPDKALIIPYDYERYCQTDPKKERHYLTVLLLFPYLGAPVHPRNVRSEICDYIQKEYRPALEPSSHTFGYGLWVPRRQIIDSPFNRGSP